MFIHWHSAQIKLKMALRVMNKINIQVKNKQITFQIDL